MFIVISLINNRGRDDGNRQLTNKGNSTGDILLFYGLIYREGNNHDLSNHVLVLFGVKYVYQGSIFLEAASPIFFALQQTVQVLNDSSFLRIITTEALFPILNSLTVFHAYKR